MGQITKQEWTGEAKANLAVTLLPACKVGDIWVLLLGCLLVQGWALPALVQLTPPEFLCLFNIRADTLSQALVHQ